jgi:hypothetical protein
MKDSILAYVLTAGDMQELDEIVTLLQHPESDFTRHARKALVERLHLLQLRLKACPELRSDPLVPKIPNVEPLTAAEINELNRFSDILRVYLTLPLRAAFAEAHPESKDEDDPCPWQMAYLRIQRYTPHDLALYIATLRRILQFTDCKPGGYEGIKLYLGVRTPADGKQHSDPAGWLEHRVLFKHPKPSASQFVLGCIQRTIYAIPEFHS